MRSIRLNRRNDARSKVVLLAPHIWSQFAYFRVLMRDAGDKDDASVTMSDDIECLLVFLKRRLIGSIEDCITLLGTCDMLGLDENALLRGSINTERVRLALDFASTPISHALCDIFRSSLPEPSAPSTDLTQVLTRSVKWRSLCVNMLLMDPPSDPRNLSNMLRLHKQEPTTPLQKSIQETMHSIT